MTDATEALDVLRGLTEVPVVVCIQTAIDTDGKTMPCRQPAVGTVDHGKFPSCEPCLDNCERAGRHVARHGFVAAGQSADVQTRAFLNKLIQKLDGDCAKLLGELERVRASVLAAARILIGAPEPDDDDEEYDGG